MRMRRWGLGWGGTQRESPWNSEATETGGPLFSHPSVYLSLSFLPGTMRGAGTHTLVSHRHFKIQPVFVASLQASWAPLPCSHLCVSQRGTGVISTPPAPPSASPVVSGVGSPSVHGRPPFLSLCGHLLQALSDCLPLATTVR